MKRGLPGKLLDVLPRAGSGTVVHPDPRKRLGRVVVVVGVASVVGTAKEAA